MKATVLKNINKLFPLPQHPFNMNNEGITTYSRWQYEKGKDTIKYYLEFADTQTMFENKVVVDLGCGAAGKTLYYASMGVEKIYGVEILEKYKKDADALAESLNLKDKFEFVTADGAKLPFEAGTIDTIIINDAMEHVDDPDGVLQDCLRVLKVGGRVYANFPPYYHPYGAHLSDTIGMPWVHMFFDEPTLVKVYKDSVEDLPDGKDRVAFRISKNIDNKEYFSYINHMTIKRFKGILNRAQINPLYYREVPLRPVLAPVASLPLLKEMFVKMVVCIIEKTSETK